jgi:hypothetical protein
MELHPNFHQEIEQFRQASLRHRHCDFTEGSHEGSHLTFATKFFQVFLVNDKMTIAFVPLTNFMSTISDI